VADGTISSTIAKQVFEIMLETGDAPSKIVEDRPHADSDTGSIDAEIDKSGCQRRQGRGVQGGQAAAIRLLCRPNDEAMARKADPQVVNERLRSKLN
jgi:aspartyl-tRNA(Asn)/glutamyl-tRNA(Gln) amidotransferase subunit B